MHQYLMIALLALIILFACIIIFIETRKGRALLLRVRESRFRKKRQKKESKQISSLCVSCGGERDLASILLMDHSDEEAARAFAQFDKCEKCKKYLATPGVDGGLSIQC